MVLILLAVAVAGFEAAGAGLIYVLLGLVSADPGQVTLPVIGRLVDRFPNLSIGELQLAMAAFVVVFFLVRAVVVIGQNFVQARVVNNAGARLSTHLVRGYLAMPYILHTKTNSSELVRNAFDSVQNLVTQVMRPGVEVVAELMMVAGLTVFLVTVAPGSALIALALLGPMVWVLQGVVQPKLKRLGRESQEARREALKAIQQAVGGVRDIRLLGREDAFAADYWRHRQAMARADYVSMALSGVPRTILETGLVMVIAVILAVALLSGAGQETVIATLGVFAYAGLRLQPSLRRIVQGLNHVRFGEAIIDDLMADRQRVDEALAAWRQRRSAGTTGVGFNRAIELKDVSFEFEPGRAALVDVSLTITKGEFVGIVGPTGGGKSTLVDLISGLLQPTSGEVSIDGSRLEENPSWWFAELGVVSQSVFLIDDTMRHNIAFGLSDGEIDEDRLQRAVERSQLLEVVRQLPDGLDTIVGERGIRLSGGQRQRVAVARALYREPTVIIFDEGTSALDSATEASLVSAIDELKEGRTLISVAHRISTVRAADRIYVVDQGHLVASGSHADLQDSSDLFRSLAR